MLRKTPPRLEDAAAIPEAVRRLEKINLGIQDSYFRITLCYPHHLCQKIRRYNCVIIQQQKIVGATLQRITNTNIVPASEAEIVFIPDGPHFRKILFEIFNGRIMGTIIYKHDLKVLIVQFPDGLQTICGDLIAVPVQEDEAYSREPGFFWFKD